MLSFTVRMRFDEADHDAVAEMLRHLTRASRQEPGCVSYIPHFVADDPGVVVLYEQYVDEAALDHHRNTPHFHQHAVGGLYQRMRERQLEILNAVL
jgi:quinol monooxygenase YgiN